MDPDKVFCHNPDCLARGKLGLNNIGYSLKQSRYICHICGKTFTDTKKCSIASNILTLL
jgi:transposase-like protein